MHKKNNTNIHEQNNRSREDANFQQKKKTGHATSCCGMIAKTNVNMIIYRYIGNKRIRLLVIFTMHFCRVLSFLMLKKKLIWHLYIFRIHLIPQNNGCINVDKSNAFPNFVCLISLKTMQ